MQRHRRRKQKIGRNEPCPCGSGKKYKYCHGGIHSARTPSSIPSQAHTKSVQSPELARRIELASQVHLGDERRRTDSQGLGKGIISSEMKGTRFVGVGSTLYYSPKWDNFHDFLNDYLKGLLGSWFSDQAKLPETERHEVAKWFAKIRELIRSHRAENKEGPIEIPFTGASRAWLDLAYDLYCLQHNAELQKKLITRLKNADQFWGALCEVRVAAILIRAGYEIEFEDEDDRRSTHCEYTATNKEKNATFSVEVKHRELGAGPTRIGRLLNSALRKEAEHQRLVFIEFLRDISLSEEHAMRFFQTNAKRIRQLEKESADQQAYVVMSCCPYYQNLDAEISPIAYFAESFNIEDFRSDRSFASYREAHKARQSHKIVFDLLESIRTHNRIPINFDEEHKAEKGIIIGEKYVFTGVSDIPGKVTDALVQESTQEAIVSVSFDDGTATLLHHKLSDEEFERYKNHPDTFFGVVKETNNHLESPLDLFEFFLKDTRQRDRENLLRMLKEAPDLDELQKLETEDLREILAERWTIGATNT